MRKMIIADDESIIRNGLRKALNWQELNIDIVGEAEDGLQALELAKEHSPDLMLVDINMPLMNGIELIEKICVLNSKCKIIIITGYDEFEYAREAIRLKVSDYILKPVAKSKLREVIIRVLKGMDESMEKETYSNWAQQKVESSKAYLLSEFFGKWMAGAIPREEILLQLRLFGFPQKRANIINVGLVGSRDFTLSDNAMEKDLMLFCINNIMMELCSDQKNCVVLNDDNDNVICIYTSDADTNNPLLEDMIRKTIRKYLKCDVFTVAEKVEMVELDMLAAYKKIQEKIKNERALTPVVAFAKYMIDSQYDDKNLSLDHLSEKLDISPQYLSKLIRKELGLTYKSYLTQVRIEKAIMYMKDPMKRMYEIADQVGYKSQHYFSAAFKKVKGMSPNDYKSKYL